MRIAHASRPRVGRMNITPMIDLAFLLITFFVMTLHLGLAQEEKILLPRADQARTTHQTRVTLVTVTIGPEGRLFTGGRELSVEDLEAELRGRMAGGEDLKIVVRADRNSPFDTVKRVMRAAALAGVEKLSISALKIEAAE